MINTQCKASITVNANVVLWVALRSSTSQDQKPKQFKNYLANVRNKELLIEFLFQGWTTCDPGKLGNVLLVVAHAEVCYSIVINDAVVVVTEVPDMFLISWGNKYTASPSCTPGSSGLQQCDH